MKKRLFVVCFVFVLASSLVNSSQAQEANSASFYDGYGYITLSWSHSLSVPSGLAYSEVNVNAEKYEQGYANAAAIADTSAMAGDSGLVGATVAAQSETIGSKGLADAGGKAQNFFLLENTSDQNVKVRFDWSAEWLVEGAIENPETDRVEAALQLVLEKKVVRFNNARMLADRIAHNIQQRHIPRSIFSEFSSSDLVPELSFHDSDGVTGDFTIHFGPGMTYLFVLSAELQGFATVSLGGCPSSYWRASRDWPIDRWLRFVDVFGAGPRNLSLVNAVSLRQSTQDVLMSNAVSALLNAASPEIPYVTDDVDEIIALIRTAFESGEFELANAELEYYNNLGYPQICE